MRNNRSDLVNFFSQYYIKVKSKSFTLVSIVFIVFTTLFILAIKTVDIYNTRFFLYYSSFFYVSVNPYLNFSSPTPPIFFSILFPQFYVYILSTNIQLTVIFIRFINLLFLLISAILTYFIVEKISGNKFRARSGFLLILFSPFLFYVSFVFNEQDIVPIALTLVSVYLILFSKDSALKFTGVIIFSYASFFYYFPLLILPAILIYQRKFTQFLSLFIMFVVTLLFFYSLFIIDLRWDFTNNGVSAISSTGAQIPAFSILNLFSPGIFDTYSSSLSFVSEIFIIISILSLLFIPIITRFFKINIFTAFAIIYAIPFLFIKIYNEDEFIWMIPFFTISLSLFSPEKRIKSRNLLAQLCILPSLVVFNMYGAPEFGQGTGFFYLTYLQFHQPIEIYSIIPFNVEVTKILDLVGFISIFLVVVYVLKLNYVKQTLKVNANQIKTNLSSLTNKMILLHRNIIHYLTTPDKVSKLLLEMRKTIFSIKKSKKIGIIAISLLMLSVWILGGLTQIEKSNNEIVYNKGPFPLAYFFGNNLEMNSNYTYNFMNNNSYVQLSNYSGNLVPPSIFYRSLYNQNINITLEALPNLPSNVISNDTFAGLNGLNISIVNRLHPLGNYKVMSPFNSENSSIVGNSGILPLGVNSTPIISMSGTSVEEYNISSNQSLGVTYLLGFKQEISNVSQNLLFYLDMHGNVFELFYEGKTLYFMHYSPNAQAQFQLIDQSHYSLSWNIVSISFNERNVSFNINGYEIGSQSLTKAIGNVSNILVGSAGLGTFYQNRFSFYGMVTPLLSINTSLLHYSSYLGMCFKGVNYFQILSSHNVTLIANNSQVKIINGQDTKNFFGTFNFLWFGRPYTFSPSIVFSIHHLSIERNRSSPIFLDMILIAYVFPTLVFLISSVKIFEYIRLRYKNT